MGDDRLPFYDAIYRLQTSVTARKELLTAFGSFRSQQRLYRKVRIADLEALNFARENA